jgi:aminoglycoside phosphotransferase (APT) family kinase protein
LKLDNCQFDPADPDRVLSIFDWDMTTLGDPLIDLGTLLNYWPDPDDSEATSRGTRPGSRPDGLAARARDRRARYAARSGADVAAGPLVGGVRAVEDRRGRPAASPPLGARGRSTIPAWPGSPTASRP